MGLSVIRPLPWQSGSLIYSRAPYLYSGQTTESWQDSTQCHDVKPTEIGQRRALALAPPILVVWCASHLVTCVLCVNTKYVQSLSLRLKGSCKSACDKKCNIACNKCNENVLDTTVWMYKKFPGRTEKSLTCFFTLFASRFFVGTVFSFLHKKEMRLREWEQEASSGCGW